MVVFFSKLTKVTGQVTEFHPFRDMPVMFCVTDALRAIDAGMTGEKIAHNASDGRVRTDFRTEQFDRHDR